MLRDFNLWANSNCLHPKAGNLDRYIHSRMLQLEILEGRITPATYTVFTTLDNGTGSLRQAILDANLNAGPDIINFAITGGTGAIQTITLDTALPVITDQVAIDGTTQLGYIANTLSVGAGNNAAIKIQLNGANLLKGGEVGLYLNSAGSSVTGLSFVNFPFAIYANNNNITIKGNYFGVNADGTAQSNGLSGVGVDVATVNAAIVGGNTAADQNVFGNLTTGIVQVAGSGSSFTGNRIGMGTTNASFMPNTTGIQINNNANVDALNHSISANLIGKNTTGIKLIGFQGATVPGTGKVIGTQIVGNLIGTDSLGSTNNLGNSGDAISIDDGVTNTAIGNSIKPNTIAYSNQNGVLIVGVSSVGNTIEYNNIRNNLGLGILLLNGANNNIASPVLTQQIPNGTGGFTYSGFVNGVANTQYTVDFYSSLISDSRSQGANYLGSTTLTTDANGNFGFTGFAPTQNQTAQGANYVVTATATNVGFGTSVFSAGPPAQISVVSGSSQTAMVGTAFTNPLTAKVVDSRGDPVPNMQVQFAAPNSNPPTNPATGLFAGSLQTIIAITGVTGEAASTTLTANNAPGNFTVLAQVVNNAGIAPVSFALTNTPPAPTIISFTPTSGQVGTSVVISGSGFVGSVQVNFSGATATNVVVNSANQITAMVPTGATTGLITVTTPGGTVTTTTNFTVSSFVTPFRVTNTLDSGPGSLRQAIDDANATADDDVIEFNFAPSTGPYTITLISSLPNILDASSSGTLTITGLGAPSLTISGSDPTNPNNSTRNFNIFSIDSDGDLSISGVTVSGAQTTGKGGAFNNAGTLKVSNSTISGNKAGDSGGAIYNDMGGTLTVTNSIISGNKSGDSGGGIYNSGTLNVNDSTLSGNTSTYGGGIYNDIGGTLTVTNSTFSNNLAATGGGIQNNSSLTVINSTISGNTVNRGGGIYNDFGGTLKVNNTIISGNTAKYGGGIYTRGILTVTNSTLSGNTANRGGGIRNNDTLTVIGSTISGNTAEYGGGIYNSDILTVIGSTISGNTAKYGGGIFIDMDGTLTVTNSTISGNTPDNIMDEGADKSFEVSSPSAPIPFPLNNSITKDLAILTGITQATLPDYVATIDWGDDSEDTAGVITPAPNQPGVFQILGTHTYSSLEIFNGSVTVTRVSDDESSSSDFNAVVLTPSQKDNLNGASGAVLKPGGQSADARINGINTLYVQSADNTKPVILVAAAFKDNPQAYATTLPAQQFYDVRLLNPGGRSLLTLTAKFAGGLQRGSSPYIQFAQDNSTSYKNVVSANNQVVINYINSTITVFFDKTSFPLINNLRGTVFAVVTSNTQVSSNTVTVLPATFTGGTAVSIAWGAASTLADVASAASASNTTLTFQNSRQTTLSLAPSQSKGTVILRAVNNGGTTNDLASKETIKQLTSPDILQSIIRGTIGIGPEVIGGMIKKMLPENAGNFLREWSKVISEIKDVPNDMITPKVNAIPEINKGSSIDKPEECDDSLLEDAAFDDISKISSALGLADESSHCLNGVSSDPMLEELAFSGEINWAGLALSTLTLSQFPTFSMDKSKRVRPIKVGA